MDEWRNALIPPTAKILDAIRAIDSSRCRIALVVDANDRLLGTITDGDVRRGMLAGLTRNDAAEQLMNKSPVTGLREDGVEALIEKMAAKLLRQIPVLDADGRVIDLHTTESLQKRMTAHPNWVVVMAGGLGKRLRPLTEDTPKPMLEVGGRPLLETIVTTLSQQHFRRFYFAVNYKADVVSEHFGDGADWGVEIRYLREKEQLGTAGALGLIEDVPDHPLLVTNGDLLTNVNFESLLEYHQHHAAAATMAVREFDLQVPFGVVGLNDHRITSIDEKPVQKLFVNAGIYVINPDQIARIGRGEAVDMPTLMESIVADGHEVAAFPIREFWLDIGRTDDFDAANGKYSELFARS